MSSVYGGKQNDMVQMWCLLVFYCPFIDLNLRWDFSPVSVAIYIGSAVRPLNKSVYDYFYHLCSRKIANYNPTTFEPLVPNALI